MKKLLLFISFILFAVMQIGAQSVSISESEGWLESAYVKWLPLEGAMGYNVYYKDVNVSGSEYTQTDGMLIRKYSGYFRADVVGLQAGNYVLKVVPVIDSTEEVSKEAVTSVLTVKPYIREGFAFSQNSPYKTGSGAYNENGTLRAGAKVLYMTAETANTMELSVVVDGKGKEELRTGIVDILAGKQKGYDKTPLAIRVVGEVKGSDIEGLNSSGYIQIKGKSAYSELNITLEGIGDDAVANGWAVLVRSAGNIEVRNLGIMNFEDDGISLDTENTNVWVHNNDFFYGKQGSGDKAKGDGSFDVKGDSQYVTASYNHFWDSGKASLCGMTSETSPNYITYHHNWFDHSDSRHPRVRTMTVHVYNNYFDGNAKYGVGATTGSSVFVENNYFRNCKSPMLISKQGSDVFFDSKGTFSGEAGGMIKSFGNHMEGARRFVDQNTSATDFDAITVTTREEQIPATYKTLLGGNTYNNFDTNTAIMYAYTPHTADEAKNDVMQYAGRVNGGDLKWTFNNSVDDNSSDINSGLRTAVNSYKGTVLAIGSGSIDDGDDNEGGEEGEGGGEGGSAACTKEYVPAAGINTDNAFTTVGSMSSNGGNQSYNSTALAKGLKMDSKGSIKFTTTTDNATLIVGVIANKANSALKLNNNTAGLDGIGTSFVEKTVTLGSAGEYTIIKGTNECYVYYLVVKEVCSTTGVETVEKLNFTVYPNPVTDRLYISSEGEITRVEVYSMAGALLMQHTGNVKSVDMSNLSKGSYIVNICSATNTYKQIVIKK